MSHPVVRPPSRIRLRRALLASIALIVLAGWLLPPALSRSPGTAQAPAEATPVKGANFKQAYKYSSEYLRQFVYSTSVAPQWIGKSDSFWYQWNTSKGKQWYRVNPQTATKVPLFDRVKLGAQLSELVRKPLEPALLPLSVVSLDAEGTKLKFAAEGSQFEYDLRTEKLTKGGPATIQPKGTGGMTPDQLDKLKGMLGEQRVQELVEKLEKLESGEYNLADASLEEYFADLDVYEEALPQLGETRSLLEIAEEAQQKKGGKGEKGKNQPAKGGDPRVFSPDEKHYVYAMNNNLYLGEAGGDAEDVQLTKDGADGYSFAPTGGGGIGGNVADQKDKEKDKDKKLRPSVTWSKDSKAFYANRTDVRGVKELFLVNSIANPRPTLTRYTYPMPGDENVRKTELHVLGLAKKKLVRVETKWKDETYGDLHWGKTSEDLRFIRSDRLHRNSEFCTVNPMTGEAKCIILEGFENANLVVQPARYLDDSAEMLWWSERSSWGHYYLYDRAGKMKNAVTAGDFRASAIVQIDAKNRVLYFRGNAREPGENVYFNHLYSVHFDGTGLTLLDPGNGNHDALLSPNRQFVVDNCSRFDEAPTTVLRDARGNKIMDLEKADLSKLQEVGWRMPETFIVKAADGVTDLYGNMWKPYDFDPKKKYPVIAHVYPGPQTESMSHGFQAISPQQQLAQLNFIVIQVGNRGGTPLRSKAYQSHSYWNMRDYGLADKKTAIEQLAAKSPWIDIDRIGIYGHSGGGFMSTAALVVKPYNDFFKVAVSSAGNHDNNVYNNSWAERYHGMKEVPIKAGEEKKAETKTTPPKKKKGGDDLSPDQVDQGDSQKGDDKKATEEKKDLKGKDQSKDGKDGKDKDGKDTKGKDDKKEVKAKEPTRFEIKVPTNPELAANLKGKLLLVHGDMDNNVHPAHTIRMADALIKANKRFDMLMLPGKAHGFADYQAYFNQRMWEYFAEHLLDDRSTGADIYDRREQAK